MSAQLMRLREKSALYVADDNAYIFECPHCEMLVQVGIKDLQCKIFRHGAMKANVNKQISAHESKEECDRLKSEDLIYGCGKPFKIVKLNGGEMCVEECGYI